MKKHFILMAILFTTGMALAQEPERTHGRKKSELRKMNPDDQAREESKRMTEKLSLTGDQTAVYEKAVRERIAVNGPIKEKMNGSTTPDEREQLRKQMKSNRQSFNSKVIAMLTPEQKTKWEDIKKERKNKHKGNHHGKH